MDAVGFGVLAGGASVGAGACVWFCAGVAEGVAGAAEGEAVAEGATVASGVFFAAFTVILHTAFAFLLLLETAVMFAVPVFFAVTTPFLLTLATAFLLDFQVTFLFAFAGVTFFTFKVNLSPTDNVFLVAFSFSFFVLGAAFAAGAKENAETTRASDKNAATILFEFFLIF